MLQVYLCGGRLLVWEAEAIYRLRAEHRLVGRLLGSPPGRSRQSSQCGPPLSLLYEEALLAVEEGFAQLVDGSLLEEGGGEERVGEEGGQVLSDGCYVREADEEADEDGWWMEEGGEEMDSSHWEEGEEEGDLLEAPFFPPAHPTTHSSTLPDSLLTSLSQSLPAPVPSSQAPSLPPSEVQQVGRESNAHTSASSHGPRSTTDGLLASTRRFRAVATHCEALARSDLPSLPLSRLREEGEGRRVHARVFRELWMRGCFITPATTFGADYLWCAHAS